MDSILTSIKKLLGIVEGYDHFDADIMFHINTVFMTLTQLGVGPKEGFFIKESSTPWSEFISDDSRLQAIKSYMYLKVKLLFDPPSSSFVLDSMDKTCTQLEWRIAHQVDINTIEGGATIV